jgi:tetratricopeptide (TPR) repeat protein
MRLSALLGIAFFLSASFPAAAVEDSERVALYKEFRAAFDAGSYESALPLAERLVRLTEEQYGARDLALVNPLVNLGTLHYRLRHYDPALDNYRRSIEILEAKAEKTDRQFIRALHGLGATYHALQRDEEAAVALKRAVDLSRNLDGLFNTEQLVVLRPLIASYTVLNRTEEAGKEEQYAFTIAENSFGKDDARLLPALDRYARYYESIGRYATARAVHGRAITLGEKVGGRNSTLSVDGLRGVARTYRLAWLYGEEDPQDSSGNQPTSMAGAGMLMPSSTLHGGAPNSDGERALRAALQVLTAKDKPLQHGLTGAVLVDLGDWYLTAGATDRALITYRDAWKYLSTSGSTAVLTQPVQLVYRAPNASTHRNAANADEWDPHTVKLRFNVTPGGEVQDIVNAGGDASESQTRSVIGAFRKARYRPRLENGEPVATAGVEFQTQVFTKHKEEKT